MTHALNRTPHTLRLAYCKGRYIKVSRLLKSIRQLHYYFFACFSLILLHSTPTLAEAQTQQISNQKTDKHKTDKHSAQEAFASYGSSIYQVQIINVKSQNLNSSGSGFFVDNGFLFATNYHVVSSVVLEPEEYDIILERDDMKLELDVVAIDVVNDLALLSVPSYGEPLVLNQIEPQQGEKLYSVGNPHNIGMTIVEGNYNGLAEDQVFDRIHFSGAINPGMSGGPTINGNGEVIGINVQTGGNQLGFLVPVEKLTQLLTEYQTESDKKHLNHNTSSDDIDSIKADTTVYERLKKSIGGQVEMATSSIIDTIFEQDSWPSEELAGKTVVGKIHPAFSCWGTSKENEKKRVLSVVKSCSSGQNIYVSQELNTGYLDYKFQLVSGEEWPADAFYRYASRRFSSGRAPNRAGEKDVENFECINDLISSGEEKSNKKVAYCTRSYKDFPNLYDTFYIATTADKKNQILMEQFRLSGVNRTYAQRFLKLFMQQGEMK